MKINKIFQQTAAQGALFFVLVRFFSTLSCQLSRNEVYSKILKYGIILLFSKMSQYLDDKTCDLGTQLKIMSRHCKPQSVVPKLSRLLRGPVINSYFHSIIIIPCL